MPLKETVTHCLVVFQYYSCWLLLLLFVLCMSLNLETEIESSRPTYYETSKMQDLEDKTRKTAAASFSAISSSTTEKPLSSVSKHNCLLQDEARFKVLSLVKYFFTDSCYKNQNRQRNRRTKKRRRLIWNYSKRN